MTECPACTPCTIHKGLKLCQGMFRLNIRKRFITWSVAEHWNTSPGQWSQPQGCQSLRAVCKRGAWRDSWGCPVQGQELESMILVCLFHSTLGYFVIPWFYPCCLRIVAVRALSGGGSVKECRKRCSYTISEEKRKTTPNLSLLRKEKREGGGGIMAEAQVPVLSARKGGQEEQLKGQREGFLPPKLPVAAGLYLGSFLQSAPWGLLAEVLLPMDSVTNNIKYVLSLLL